jgi:hypothetical protein
MAVIGGDFSADSLMSLAQLYLQDKARIEKYEDEIDHALMKIDPIADAGRKNPILKHTPKSGSGAECKLNRDRESALPRIGHRCD